MSEYQILQHFPSWREAVRAAGLEPDSTNLKLDDSELLQDWGELVRKHRHIPTRAQYRREGKYSPGVFERHFGPWSAIPSKFREYGRDKPEWTDVVALLPPVVAKRAMRDGTGMISGSLPETAPTSTAPSIVTRN